MTPEEFTRLMYEEWKKETLDLCIQLCETTYFNQLWALRENLYDFFHPLGISTCGIHDVARVAGDVAYAVLDDGDLSIVVAEVLPSEDIINHNIELLKEIKPDYQPEPVEPLLEVFVVFGHHEELREGAISHQVRRHSPECRLGGYIAKRFGEEALGKLASFVPRFEEERRLAQDLGDALEYFAYREQTKLMLRDMVQGLP